MPFKICPAFGKIARGYYNLESKNHDVGFAELEGRRLEKFIHTNQVSRDAEEEDVVEDDAEAEEQVQTKPKRGSKK